MMFAVTIEPLNTVIFVSDRPETAEWKVEEGVGLDLPMNFDDRPEGATSPKHVLCRSMSDQKIYKVFRQPSEVDPTEFEVTGRTFGGVFSKPTWERFAKVLSSELATPSIDEEDAADVMEEAMRGIREVD